MKKFLEIFYLIKFLIYGFIAAYDYAIGSKFTLAWLLLSIMCLAFYVIDEIKISLNKPI